MIYLDLEQIAVASYPRNSDRKGNKKKKPKKHLGSNDTRPESRELQSWAYIVRQHSRRVSQGQSQNKKR